MVVAIAARVMNLLSVAAAYGVLGAFLQGGWAGDLIGIDSPTPVAGYVPVIMFALLFGLSMDYEVFLVSRIRETWVRTADNDQAILSGLAGTGRVITAAAAIMVVVFAALISLDDVPHEVLRRGHGRGHRRGCHPHPDAAGPRAHAAAGMYLKTGGRPECSDGWMPQLHVEGRPDTFWTERVEEPVRV